MQKAVSGGFFRESYTWCKYGIICDSVTTAESVPKQGMTFCHVTAVRVAAACRNPGGTVEFYSSSLL
ncbi:MAG: hypothetical protein UH249_03535 [Acutalibacteraceae bacterium]|nr:hypothetical protein [Acutalibacteraceae bacterium]